MNEDPTLGGLSPATWDQVAGPHFYSTSAWLGYCSAETGTPGEAAVVRDGDRVVCAAPIRELSGLPAWSRYRWNEHLTEFGLPQLPDKGKLVGPPEGFQTHFLGPKDDESVKRLVEEIRKADEVSVAMYLTTEDVLAARRAGVTSEPVLLDADGWVAVPEDGWQGWLASLPKKRRRSARHEDLLFRDAGYEIVHLPLAECVEQLGLPAAATLRKYGHYTTPETELVSLRRTVEHLGDSARVAVCQLRAGEPLGFCIYYVRGDTIFIRWVGFDYDRLVGAAEYFHLVFYDHVKRAPELGVRWIHVGVTSPEAKALHGAELRPLWLLDLSADSVLSAVPDQVRSHNARLLEKFAGDSRTSSALTSRDAWQVTDG